MQVTFHASTLFHSKVGGQYNQEVFKRNPCHLAKVEWKIGYIRFCTIYYVFILLMKCQ